MSLKHSEDQLFRNRAVPGGSRKGKPQNLWPWVLVLAMDAIIERALGAPVQWCHRACPLSLTDISGQMHLLVPGWRSWVADNHVPTKTPPLRLLRNRVYKMYYSGTSDRGANHDPATRATMSKEHYSKHLAPDHPLVRLRADIVACQVMTVPNWRDYL